MQPRWLRLKVAAQYASLGQKKLKDMAKAGTIAGYQDKDSGRGDWIFDRLSIDQYRENPLQSSQDNVAGALAKIRRSM